MNSSTQQIPRLFSELQKLYPHLVVATQPTIAARPSQQSFSAAFKKASSMMHNRSAGEKISFQELKKKTNRITSFLEKHHISSITTDEILKALIETFNPWFSNETSRWDTLQMEAPLTKPQLKDFHNDCSNR